MLADESPGLRQRLDAAVHVDAAVGQLAGALARVDEQRANAAVDVLLRGNAVNYAVRSQDASGLKFGDQAQTQPPQIAGDLAKLTGKGAKIFVVEDALRERGIGKAELIEGLELIPRQGVPKLYGEYDQVWQW